MAGKAMAMASPGMPGQRTLTDVLMEALGGEPFPLVVYDLPYEKKIAVVFEVKGKNMRLDDNEEGFPSQTLLGKIQLLRE